MTRDHAKLCRGNFVTGAAPAIFWRRRARHTALRYNLGSALGAFLPAYLALSAAFACALLVLREHGPVDRAAWVIYAVGVVGCLGFALWHVRARLFTLADALVRLDWQGGLHNRLSAAAAGVGAFPAPRRVEDGYTFHWPRIAAPALGAVALVWVAAIVPLPGRAGGAFAPAVPPVAWTQAAQWVDALQKSDLLQEPALAEVRERLEQLRQQSPRDWYSQSSLEAGDNLRDQTAQSIDSLQRDLHAALSSVEAAQKFTDQTPASEMKATHENLNQALKGLEMGNLPLNRDLLDKLKGVDPTGAKILTKAQMDSLQQRLKAGAKVVQAALGDGEGANKVGTFAQGKPRGGPGGDKPGGALADGKTVGRPGGPGGGGGPAALTLDERPTDLGTSAKDAVSNPDMEHAVPGDVVAVGKGEHTVDPTKYVGPVSGGAIASPGAGGDAVWRNDLTPREREVVKSFFK